MTPQTDSSSDAGADAASPGDEGPGGGPLTERGELSRERIVSVAVSLIDESGLPQLSMRRLGAALGVEAMSLYRYVPGKERLLDAVVQQCLSELDRDEAVLASPQYGWQDFLQRLAHGIRRMALAHPKVFPLVASRPTAAPWLRPPLRSLAWVEVFLDGLLAEGFSDEAAVAAYRSFTGFLLGHLLLEVTQHGADVGPLDVLADPPDAGDDLPSYPTVSRLQESLSQDHADLEFEEALEKLLERLELTRSTV